MNEVLTIEQAEYSGGYTLVLLFSNGEKREFDFASLLDKGVCRKLRDMDFLRTSRLMAFRWIGTTKSASRPSSCMKTVLH